jgi:RHS repeat-associated protein
MTNVRYVRDWLNGSTSNVGDHWVEIQVWGERTTTYIGSHFEWSGSTATMKKYYYAGSTRVAMRTGSGTPNFLLSDHLGSNSVVTDSSGAKVSATRYLPWGEARFVEGPSQTSFQYTGQRAEKGLGLYFYGARWYDPALGRFAQADTIIPQEQGVQAWDRYAYVNNSPVNLVDPSGHGGRRPNTTSKGGSDAYLPIVANNSSPENNASPESTPEPQLPGGGNTTVSNSSQNPPAALLVILAIPLTVTAAATELVLFADEAMVAPLVLVQPEVADLTCAYLVYTSKVIQNPDEYQTFEWLPPWGLGEK